MKKRNENQRNTKLMMKNNRNMQKQCMKALSKVLLWIGLIDSWCNMLQTSERQRKNVGIIFSDEHNLTSSFRKILSHKLFDSSWGNSYIQFRMKKYNSVSLVVKTSCAKISKSVQIFCLRMSKKCAFSLYFSENSLKLQKWLVFGIKKVKSLQKHCPALEEYLVTISCLTIKCKRVLFKYIIFRSLLQLRCPEYQFEELMDL